MAGVLDLGGPGNQGGLMTIGGGFDQATMYVALF